jgi:GrpB-like predicted nucleotidyltransferase (UPF0157 family)
MNYKVLFIGPMMAIMAKGPYKVLIYAGIAFVPLYAALGTLSLWKVILASLIVGVVYRLWTRKRLLRTLFTMATAGNEHPAAKLDLHPWNDSWKTEVANEHARLDKFITKYDHMIDRTVTDGIAHVGSTSIQKICLAKPLHDMAIAVKYDVLPEEFIKDLEGFGYLYLGASPHDPDDDYWFMKFNTDPKEIEVYGRGFDIHVTCKPGHHTIEIMKTYRDYCNCHPEAVKRYGDTKKKIWDETHDQTIMDYAMKKMNTVQEIIRLSQEWNKNGRK